MFTVSEPNRDGIAYQYTLVAPHAVNAAALVGEIEAAIGRQLQGEGQAGSIATANLAYGAGAIVMIRIRDGQPALSQGEQDAAEAVILGHGA